MATAKVYITAGLPVPKNAGQSATGNASVFDTAGLLAEPLETSSSSSS